MRVNFVLSEVATGLRRNMTMTVAMILTTAISLGLMGTGLLIAGMISDMKEIYYDKVQVSIFLADGVTPIPDVERALGIEGWPHAGTYDTLAGFLMVMLRRIPRRTDVVEWEGWRFEVVDVDSYRVDQVMITAVAPAGPVRN